MLTAELAARETRLAQQVEATSQGLREISPLPVEEARLGRDVRVAEELFINLRKRYEESRLAEVSVTPDVRLLDAATVPEKPLYNRAPLAILLALVGGLGLGVMGAPICRNLATKSGEKLLGFDLDSAPLARLKEQGVDAAASVHEVAERCDMVFLSLPGVPEVKMVCAGPDSLMLHAHSGSCVIDLSTTTVALARDLNSRFAARGVHFADAPIARTREAAEKGTLSVMVGSTEQMFNRIRPTLAHIATDITHCGGPGTGPATPWPSPMPR